MKRARTRPDSLPPDLDPASDVALPSVLPTGRALRMRDLAARTGLARAAIHFYIAQGLLPSGEKTGRNTATYDESHVERLLLIRRLQSERFLPLKAIKALLDGHAGGYTAEQRSLLSEIGRGFRTGPLAEPRERSKKPATLSSSALAKRAGVDTSDVEELAEAGLLRSEKKSGKRAVVEDDAWLVDAWAELRGLGFDESVGLRASDLEVLDDVAQHFLDQLLELLGPKLDKLSPAKAAQMIERALPIAGHIVLRLHTQKVRALFDAMDATSIGSPKKTNERRSP